TSDSAPGNRDGVGRRPGHGAADDVDCPPVAAGRSRAVRALGRAIAATDSGFYAVFRGLGRELLRGVAPALLAPGRPWGDLRDAGRGGVDVLAEVRRAPRWAPP